MPHSPRSMLPYCAVIGSFPGLLGLHAHADQGHAYLGCRRVRASGGRSAAACRRGLGGSRAQAGSAGPQQRAQVEAREAAAGCLLRLRSLGDLGKEGRHWIAWTMDDMLSITRYCNG